MIRDWLRWLISILDPTADRAGWRNVHYAGDGPTDTITVKLYQTEALTRHRGRTPERMQAKQIARAFDTAGVAYRVWGGHPQLYDPPMDRPGSSVELFKWWKTNGPTTEADCHLLLTDARGGGRGHPSPSIPFATHGSSRIKRLGIPRDNCETDQCANLWGGLHEVAHCLGGRHPTPMLQDKPSMHFHPNMVNLLFERFG